MSSPSKTTVIDGDKNHMSNPLKKVSHTWEDQPEKNNTKQQVELCLNIVKSHTANIIQQTIKNGILSSSFSELFGIPPNYSEFFSKFLSSSNSTELIQMLGVLRLLARLVDDGPVGAACRFFHAIRILGHFVLNARSWHSSISLEAWNLTSAWRRFL